MTCDGLTLHLLYVPFILVYFVFVVVVVLFSLVKMLKTMNISAFINLSTTVGNPTSREMVGPGTFALDKGSNKTTFRTFILHIISTSSFSHIIMHV